ncbi:MAG: hypothetical protein AMJ38_03390 [Dehalococcoidia bacterium DG_22]|nr:MAG: hypothetical protein AMJ38_03390 [Dehalococcoidia bacterium DG_22]
MVTVTAQAAEVLRATLDEARTEPGQALRLLLRPGGGFVVTADGEKILLVTPEIAEAVGEATIDAPETEEGRRLVISR